MGDTGIDGLVLSAIIGMLISNSLIISNIDVQNNKRSLLNIGDLRNDINVTFDGFCPHNLRDIYLYL